MKSYLEQAKAETKLGQIKVKSVAKDISTLPYATLAVACLPRISPEQQ